MTTKQDLSTIEAEGSRIIELGRGTPDAAVPQYLTWSLRDLVIHTARVHGRTAELCETLPTDRIGAPEPPAEADPFTWAADQLRRMLEGFRSGDLTKPVWSLTDDPTLAFWLRRMVVETGIHRWDAESAVGQAAPLPDVVAAHGLDEFGSLYLRRLGDVRAIEARATDLGRAWRWGTDETAAIVEGTASDLFLRLMSRPGVELPGDWAEAVDGLDSPADR